MSQSPYLVRKRIFEGKSLWGAVVWHQSELFKVDIRDLLGLIDYYKKPVLTDVKGADTPATVDVVHRKTKDGLAYYFRAVHDKIKGNNWNKVDKIKLVSANKLRILKP